MLCSSLKVAHSLQAGVLARRSPTTSPSGSGRWQRPIGDDPPAVFLLPLAIRAALELKRGHRNHNKLSSGAAIGSPSEPAGAIARGPSSWCPDGPPALPLSLGKTRATARAYLVEDNRCMNGQYNFAFM